METFSLKGGSALLDAQKIIRRIGVQEGAIVADLGCGGSGHFVVPSAIAAGSTGKVYALDVQKNVLHLANNRVKLHNINTVQLICSNLEAYGTASIPAASCDIALLANVLFQNKDHSAIMREAARFLKQGGTLAVLDWRATATPFGPPLSYRVSPRTVRELSVSAGLTFQEEFDPGSYHYCLMFRKN